MEEEKSHRLRSFRKYLSWTTSLTSLVEEEEGRGRSHAERRRQRLAGCELRGDAWVRICKRRERRRRRRSSRAPDEGLSFCRSLTFLDISGNKLGEWDQRRK